MSAPVTVQSSSRRIRAAWRRLDALVDLVQSAPAMLFAGGRRFLFPPREPLDGANGARGGTGGDGGGSKPRGVPATKPEAAPTLYDREGAATGKVARRQSKADCSAARVPRRMRLFTATILHSGGNVMLQAFHASVAANRNEIVRRLSRRHGGTAVASADIRIGFHSANPVTLALVPQAVAEVIREVEKQADMAANHTFVVDIEQRIEA
ncbi:hypothetical protein U1763_02545 [Sphingomonas sp. LB2R24]|uniref:hypothetical protein n=1 Tax=Sphingomonas sorbitolis TaxID=3096165 RepID=UPI002FCA1698